jgi:alanyl-tRNA synthetase
MKKSWSSKEVRSTFVDYFEKKHAHVNFKSSPVVPVNDPSLLFANAGMNQFKPIFVGTVDPSSPLASLRRAVNSQKCIRAGGKHNDLDDVGKDTYHHTFFEMLGTWSFGNYFKKESIAWAFDLLVNTYGIDPERLYASYFGGDEGLGLPADNEARQLWLEYLPPERVLPFDKSDNFWEMGDVGPCGPCSEIHYDRIGGRDASELVNADDPNVIEIWNLVFIQHNREANGSLSLLPDNHVDTGMGLERLVSILQDKSSNYDTDIFSKITQETHHLVGGKAYGGNVGLKDDKDFRDMAYRVIADHIRTLSFAIADGCVPSNEGRGYVLRRVLRRAVRYGVQTLDAKPGFLAELVPVVVGEFGDAYPELKTSSEFIRDTIATEEMAFSSLLEKGIKYLGDIIGSLEQKGGGIISGTDAFHLYDTLGFPIDLTALMAEEKGFSVDIDGFEMAMEEQKNRGRAATKSKRLAGRIDLELNVADIAFLNQQGVPITDDTLKYVWDKDTPTAMKAFLKASGDIVISGQDDTQVKEGDTIGIILEATNFYSEAGGQVADTGTILFSGENEMDVVDVQSYGGYVLHTCVAKVDFQLNTMLGKDVIARVDYTRRRQVAPNHTITHMLNYGLRKVLGDDVNQKGSLVDENKFRFDFSFGRALSPSEIERVTSIVQNVIENDLPVHSEKASLNDALEINGLRAVFGEVYPDPVNVVSVGPSLDELLGSPGKEEWQDYSIEFCGGTHISSTREAEKIVITEESAVANGIRRISGLTGAMAKRSSQIGEDLQRELQSIPSLPAQTRNSKIVSLRNIIDAADVSITLKTELKDTLEQEQKLLAAQDRKVLMQKVDAGIVEAKSLLIELVKTKEKFAILELEIGTDAKGAKRAIEELKRVAPDTPFFCVSADDDQEKLIAFAHCPKPSQDTLDAGTWIKSSLQPANGRGGGKKDVAQGSALGSEAKKLVIDAAASFAQQAYK